MLLLGGCINRINTNRALAAPDGSVVTGDPAAGEAALVQYNCGACHVIAGVPGARGLVGPSLTDAGKQAFVAGVLPNTPGNMALWIQEPQKIVPGNAIPDLDVSATEAEDMVAYLYSIR